jgi:hypothetical protein
MSLPLIPLALGMAEFAPVIARWLGSGQAETVAHHVVNIARRITGDDDPLNCVRKLSENTDLVRQFQREIIKMEAEFELQLVQDRQSARTRDLAIIQAGRRNLRADIMVISAAVGLVICLGCITLFAGRMPGEAVGIISTVAGIFGACLKDTYAFEFGSSRGSKEKDSTVAALIEQQRALGG